MGFLASYTFLFFPLLLRVHSGQVTPARATFPLYESTSPRGFPLLRDRTYSEPLPTACLDKFPNSPTKPLDAQHRVIEAAASFVRRLEKDAATLKDKLLQWACAAQAMGGEEERLSERHLFRFHSAVARLLGIVEAFSGSQAPPVAAAVTSPSLHNSPLTPRANSPEAVQWRDDARKSTGRASMVNTHSMEQLDAVRHQGRQASLAKSLPYPPPTLNLSNKLTPTTISVPHSTHRESHAFLPEQQAGEGNSARILAVPLEAQREALCNISLHWSINDWQAKCAQGAAITNAWEGLGYSNAQEAVTALTLSGKRMAGTIPDALSALAALQHLQLDSNTFTGTLPSSLFSLSLLTFLDVSNNRLSGSLPRDISDLSRLQEFSLSGNHLNGTIPGEIAKLTRLTYLVLNSNQLSGTIPEQLSSLTAATFLALSNNQLSGIIPGELTALTTLRELYLHINQLTGTISGELSALTALTALVLHTNQLSGTIPGQLSALTALKYLALHTNQLSGTIPGPLSAFTSLTFLALHTNELLGTIPGGLSDLSGLRYLHLHSNQLSGLIPIGLSALTALTYLGLSNNELHGTIAGQLSALTALTFLALSNNQLSGTIPEKLSALAELGELYLHNNKLSGTIPRQLSALNALRYLGLSTNQLSGTLPEQLSALSLLRYLHSHSNELRGILPLSFSSLKALTRLELQNTLIHGVALGLQQWVTSLTNFLATGSPLAQSSCGGFPDVVYDAALRLCVASNFLPSTEGACTDIASLKASPVFPTYRDGIAIIPPAGTASVAFLHLTLPLPCRYSKDYELLSSVHISSRGTYLPEGNDEKPDDTNWVKRRRLLLHDGQGFQGDVALLLPLWGDVAWDILGTQHGDNESTGGSTVLEMRAVLEHVSPWRANITFPANVLAVLAAHVAMPGTPPLNKNTVFLPPCADGRALVEAMEEACPFPGPCSAIALQHTTNISGCEQEYTRSTRLQEQQAGHQVKVSSVSFRMAGAPSSSGPNSLGQAEERAALILGPRPLQRPLPEVRSVVPFMNNTTSILVLPRHVHCVPWTPPTHNTEPVLLYGEVLLPHEQSILVLTNATTTTLDTAGTWPEDSSLGSLWPNGRVAQRGMQLGPSYSNIAPLPTPALLSLAVLTNPAAEAVRLHLWVNGTFHASIAFSGLGPDSLTNMHMCLANAHPEATVASQWPALDDAWYEHDAARLLGGEDLRSIRTYEQWQFAQLQWRCAEAQLWSQLPLPETVSALASWASMEGNDTETQRNNDTLADPYSSVSVGLILNNVEANFTGLEFHCFLQSSRAMHGDTACLSILSGSHVLFLHSTFILHPPVSNSSRESTPRGEAPTASTYQSLVFVYNAAVSFVNCRFTVAAFPGASSVSWSSDQETGQGDSLPVFLRTAYDAKALRAGCQTLYQHDWRRAAPAVFSVSRQQQCIDILSQQEEDHGNEASLHHLSRAFHSGGFLVSCEACHFGISAGWSAAALIARGPFVLQHTTFVVGEEEYGPRSPASAVEPVSMVKVKEMHNWNTGFGALLLFSPVEGVSPPSPGNGSSGVGFENGFFLQGWSLRYMQWSQNKDKTRTRPCKQRRLFLHDCALQIPRSNSTYDEVMPLLHGPALLQNVTLLTTPPLPHNLTVENGGSVLGYLTGLQITSLTVVPCRKGCPTFTQHSNGLGSVGEGNTTVSTMVTLEGVIANQSLWSAMASTVLAMEAFTNGMASDRRRPLPVVWHIRCGMLLLPLPAASGVAVNTSAHLAWEAVSMAWSAPQAAIVALLDGNTSFHLGSATVRGANERASPPVLHNHVAKQAVNKELLSTLSHMERLAPLTLLAMPGSSAAVEDVVFQNITCGAPAAMVLGLSQPLEESNSESSPSDAGSGQVNVHDGDNPPRSNVTFTRTFIVDNADGGLFVRQESSSSQLHCRIEDSMLHRNTAAAKGGGLLLQLILQQSQQGARPPTALDVAIENSTFVQNAAVQNGGGLACEVGGLLPGGVEIQQHLPLLHVSLSNVLLKGNVAEQEGGALHASGSGIDTVLKAVTMEGNVATVKGGGIAATQGASLTMVQGLCRSNQALSTEGGCLVVYGLGTRGLLHSSSLSTNAAPTGGGVAVTEGATLHVTNSAIATGRGHFGAGALVRGSTATLHAVVLSNNTASGCGAALAALAAHVSGSEVNVRRNTASGCGGGVYLYASTAAFTNGSSLGPGNVVSGGGESGSGDGSAVAIVNRGSLLRVDASSTVSGNGRDAWMSTAAALHCSSYGSLELESPAAWWGHNRPYDLHAEPSCTASIGKAESRGVAGGSFVATDTLFELLRHAVQVTGVAPLMMPAGDVRRLLLLQPSGTAGSDAMTAAMTVACVPTCLRLYVGQQEVSHTVVLQQQEDASTVLIFAVPPGSGTGIPVTFFLQGQEPAQEPLELLHYTPPIITDTAPRILPRAGGTLSFTGRHFGIPRFPAVDVSITIGGRACSAPRVWNDTTLTCTALGQTGVSLEVSVIVGGQSSLFLVQNTSDVAPVPMPLQMPQVDLPGHVAILTASPVSTALEQAGAANDDAADTLQRYNVLPDAVDVTLELENGDTGGIPLQSYAVRMKYVGGAYNGYSVVAACASVSCRLLMQPGYDQHVRLEAAALTEVYSDIHGNAVFGNAVSLALAWPPLPLARDEVRFHALVDGVNMSLPVRPSAKAVEASSATIIFSDGGSPPVAVAVSAFGSQAAEGYGGSCTLVLLPGFTHCASPGSKVIWEEHTGSDPCMPWDDAGFRSRCSEEALEIVEASVEGCYATSMEGTLRTCTVPLPEALVPGASYSLSLAVATAAAWSTWTTPLERGIPCPYGQGVSTQTTGSSAQQEEDGDGARLRCRPCTPGTYQAMNRAGAEATRCLKCPAGAVQPLTGQAACITCPAGSFADADQQVCLPCPLGTYGPRPGLQGNCLACAAGWYTSREGSVACTPCPTAGVLCQNGLLQVLPGYWRPPPASTPAASPLSNTSQLFHCPEPDACLAVTLPVDLQTGNTTAMGHRGNTRNTSSSTTVDDRRQVRFVHECDAAYAGPVCGVCAPGYAQLGGACTECWETSLNVIMLLLSVVAMAAIAVVLVVRSRRAKSLSSMLVRLLLDYLQLTWITGEFAARGPALFREIVGFTSLSNGVSLEISFAQCGMSSSYASRFALYMGLPLVVPAAIAVGIVLHRGVRHGIRRLCHRKRLGPRRCAALRRHCCRRSPKDSTATGEAATAKRQQQRLRMFNARVFVSASLILLVLLHSRVTREVFAAFRCYSEPLPSVEGGSVQYYLRAQLDEVCYRGWRMALAGTVGVVFVVGLPLGILLTLYRLRAAIRRGDQGVGKALGFLFAGYSIERGLWYWEAVVMFRKVWL